MFMKLIDELFTIIGAMIVLPLLVIGIAVAYHYYPVATMIIGGLVGIALCLSFFHAIVVAFNFSLSKAQAKKAGEIAAMTLVLISLSFSFYYFPKTTVGFLFLIAFGFVLGQIEKRKNTNKAA